MVAPLGALIQVQDTVKAFLTNLINHIHLLLLALILLCATACAVSQNTSSNIPSWYITPTANNFQTLYGIGDGFTLEEATKSALANAASS